MSNNRRQRAKGDLVGGHRNGACNARSLVIGSNPTPPLFFKSSGKGPREKDRKVNPINHQSYRGFPAALLDASKYAKSSVQRGLRKWAILDSNQ